MKKSKFQLGEVVLIKSTPRSYRTNNYILPSFIGKIATIVYFWHVSNNKYCYFIKEDNQMHTWSENMFISINKRFIDLNTIL